MAIALMASMCVYAQNTNDHQIGIVAHRGFWNTEETSFSENSVASLRQACINHFYGCELDIHITADGLIMVNHDDHIKGKKISTHNYSDFSGDYLPNWELRPLLDDYLSSAQQFTETMLVIEFKDSKNQIVEKTIELLKKHRMYHPTRVMFISFSLDACKKVAELCPDYTNQYLNGDLAPEDVLKLGINGIDYHFKHFQKHPEWVKEAHSLGMSVNVWTVNEEKLMKEMIDLGVDAITTNEPLLLRSILKESEKRL